MPSELYHEIVSQRGSLEELVAKIPGFKGYHEKNARRQADRALRDHLASQFEELIKRFTRIENKILDGGSGLRYMSKTREVKAKMQAYADRVKTAAPKYSGMWATFKITEDDLDRIYAFDEAQIRYQLKLENALDKLEEVVGTNEDFSDELDAVYEAAVEANEAFALRDDVILRLADSL